MLEAHAEDQKVSKKIWLPLRDARARGELPDRLLRILNLTAGWNLVPKIPVRTMAYTPARRPALHTLPIKKVFYLAVLVTVVDVLQLLLRASQVKRLLNGFRIIDRIFEQLFFAQRFEVQLVNHYW